MKKYICYSPILFSLSIITAILYCTMGTLFSLIMGRIVDAAGAGIDELIEKFIQGLVFVLIYVLVTILYGVLKNILLGKVRESLKSDLFKATLSAPTSDYSGANTAEYINDLTNNLSIFENSYVKNIYLLVTIVTMFVSASVVTIVAEPLMLVLMVALAVITVLVSNNMGKPIEKKTEEYMRCQADYVAELKDDFSAFYLIRAFGVVNNILFKHANKNMETEKTKVSTSVWQVLCQAAGQLVGLLSTVAVMAIAAYFVIKGRFSLGMIIVFGNLIGQIISPITCISEVMANISASRPVVARFKEMLAVNDSYGNENKEDFKVGLTLKNVSFSYGEKQVLHNVSFVFEKGKKYAITGANGSGKTTLINIIAGLIQGFDGDVLYDESSITDLSRESVTNLVSVVAQDTFLFNDTIRNNISLFEKSFSDKSIKQALEDAGLLKLIESFPNGLDTVVEENGKNFSGGERQRLSLARAFLRNRPILILDEGTSAVDAAAAADIEDGLLNNRDLTLIVITHNVSDEHLRRFDSALEIGA